MAIVDINSCDKQYELILADPPWKQTKGGKKSVRPNTSGKALDYPVCKLDTIQKHLQVATELTTDRAVCQAPVQTDFRFLCLTLFSSFCFNHSLNA